MADNFESLQFVFFELIDTALSHGDIDLLLYSIHTVKVREEQSSLAT